MHITENNQLHIKYIIYDGYVLIFWNKVVKNEIKVKNFKENFKHLSPIINVYLYCTATDYCRGLRVWHLCGQVNKEVWSGLLSKQWDMSPNLAISRYFLYRDPLRGHSTTSLSGHNWFCMIESACILFSSAFINYAFSLFCLKC